MATRTGGEMLAVATDAEGSGRPRRRRLVSSRPCLCLCPCL